MDPQQNVPYLILVCLARSSAEFTGEDIFDAVKKAGGGEKCDLRVENMKFGEERGFDNRHHYLRHHP